MVRRATLERDQRLAADHGASGSLPGSPAETERAVRRARQQPVRRHRGAGGRWLLWLGRGVAWALLLLIGYRGVAAIITGQPRSAVSTTGSAGAAANGYPSTLAAAYALQFGAAYLNYSPATANQRQQELAEFLPPGTDAQLGWNGAGSAQLQSEQVAEIRVQNARQAVVTLLARVNGRLLELGVPVYSSGAGLVVSGEPALLPPPSRAALPQPAAATTDSVTRAALLNQLPAFFRAYAGGDQVTLARFLAPGAHVIGLNGAVAFGSISQLAVPAGGPIRRITAAVVWNVPTPRSGAGTSSVATARASLEMTYEMTVVRRAGSWFVASIGASTELPGPP
jgi:Conjugative transposon protein TcpC